MKALTVFLAEDMEMLMDEGSVAIGPYIGIVIFLAIVIWIISSVRRCKK